MPGGIATNEKERGILLQDLSTIAADTLLITMSGDRDHLPGDRASRKILRRCERAFRQAASFSCAPGPTITAIRP